MMVSAVRKHVAYSTYSIQLLLREEPTTRPEALMLHQHTSTKKGGEKEEKGTMRKRIVEVLPIAA